MEEERGKLVQEVLAEPIPEDQAPSSMPRYVRRVESKRASVDSKEVEDTLP